MSFVVFALPRSRTAWLSRFLSYGEWTCGHEELRHMRSLDDVKSWLSQPCTGTVETSAAPFWRLLPPGMKVVTVRRSVDEVVASLARLGFDPGAMLPLMRRLDAKLNQIEAREPNVVSVRSQDLDNEAVCAGLFEHCLPYRHDTAWWARWAPVNVQCDMRAMVRYAFAYQRQTANLADAAKQQCLNEMHRGTGFVPDGMTITVEPFNAYFPGALAEIREHAAEINERYDYPDIMNFPMMQAHADAGCMQTVIARSNGRVFGYLCTVVQPAFIDRRIREAHHTSVWASPAARGLALRMYRVANDALRQNGIGRIIYRAGKRGDGPRLGAVFKRLGAEPAGQLYMQEVA